LAKVPFPVPTTYITVLRNYIDISSVVGRQILGALAKFAPTPEAEASLKAWNSNKELYGEIVAGGCLKLGEVLQLAARNDLKPSPLLKTLLHGPSLSMSSSRPFLVFNLGTTPSHLAPSLTLLPSTSLLSFSNTNRSLVARLKPSGYMVLVLTSC